MTRSRKGKTTDKIIEQARRFRKEETPAEQRLWAALRNRQLNGLKFRRQHPYEQFVLEMFCVEAQLVVEADGGIHADPEVAAHDAERTAFLARRGIRVLRFTNAEIEGNLPRVLKSIAAAALTPNPVSDRPNAENRVGRGESAPAAPSAHSPSPDGKFRRERGPGGEG